MREFANLLLIVAALLGGLGVSFRLIEVDGNTCAIGSIHQQQCPLVTWLLAGLRYDRLPVKLDDFFGLLTTWLATGNGDVCVHAALPF